MIYHQFIDVGIATVFTRVKGCQHFNLKMSRFTAGEAKGGM